MKINEALFWSRVDMSAGLDGCWLWTGKPGTSGYGGFGKPKRYAHRISAFLAHGPCPDDCEVLHACDVKLCVNPLHLRYGTRSENVRDQVERGQHYSPFSAAERARHGFPAGGACRPGGRLAW